MVSENYILLCQFEQHGVVEEFVDGYVLTEALPPPRLDHELPGQLGSGLCLQGPNHYTLVHRVPRHYLPMVKCR